ncbi:RC-LH1 core complex protein PufX [Yoonia sp.]|uniref:RC-LH1 core complex protein PufX n=1 Tax=Yoonia sp. TaxID=2212373 RepID=UPI003F6BC309
MKNENILDMSEKSRLSADITFLMLKGAGYAAAFVLSVWFVIAMIALIGKALPEESKQAPDPTPLSSLVIMAPEATTA